MSVDQRTPKTLKASLRGHKAYINRIVSQVADLQAQPLDIQSCGKLRGMTKYLETRLDILDEVVSELIIHPEISDTLVDQLATYMTESRLVIDNAENEIKKVEVTRDASGFHSTRRPSSPGPFGSSRLDSSDCHHPRTKLPKAPFPTFHGGTNGSRDLKIFLRMFDELVGPDCSDSQRITYFRVAIKGEAERFIQHIDPLPENYDLILNTLKLQYKPKEGEVRDLWGRLMNIQTWSKCSSSSDLLRLIQHVRQHVYLIKEVDPEAHTDHETLVDAIMVLLPERLMYDITRDISRTDRTVQRILTEVESFMTAREEVASYYQGVPKGTSSNSGSSRGGGLGRGHSNRGGGRPSVTNSAQAKGFSVRGASEGGISELPKPVPTARVICVYCLSTDTSHDPHTCKDRPAIDQCRTMLRAAHCCYNCLERGHAVRECPSRSLCDCGGGKHSPSICFKSG